MDHFQRKFHPINEEMVLFNEEYYVSVLQVSIGEYQTPEREQLFEHLYAFSSNDIELEIDISDEEKGVWYLQLLVPYMLTLSDAAKRRVQRGAEELQTYLQDRGVQLASTLLKGDQIYQYIKRYNPNLLVIEPN